MIKLIHVSVGLHIDHDLKYATTKALEQVEEELVESPSIILYFTGTHKGGKKTYNQAMTVLRKKYPNIPMAGCSGVGIAGKNDYGLKGAGLMFICGVNAKNNLIKRFRIGTWYKTRKVVKECERTNNSEKRRNSNTTNIFFPPGLGFPKSW